MKGVFFKKTVAAICSAAVTAALPSVYASANSAQTRWSGKTSYGAAVVGENCPIVVKNELLTFSVPDFPSNYYSYENFEDIKTYGSKVTAEYEFYNPADYSVIATLAFPFGRMPDYLYVSNENESAEDVIAEKYSVKINGEDAPYRLRHTYSEYGFSVGEDVGKLVGNFKDDDFYKSELPVTEYSYSISGLDEKYTAANAAFRFHYDGNSVVAFGGGGYRSFGDYDSQLGAWVRNRDILTVYFFGTAPDPDIGWKFYENGACEREIGGLSTYIPEKTRTTTFKEFVLSRKSGDVSDTDFYNAFIDYMNGNQTRGTVMPFFRGLFAVGSSLMRWIEYDIGLQSGETLINEVSVPVFPSIDIAYSSAVYGYEYLLSPAKTWADFSALKIVVDTPYYMTKSSFEGFTKTENGYELSINGLPDGELEFTLCAEQSPFLKRYNYGEKTGGFDFLPLIMVLTVAGLIALTAFAILFAGRKKT